jgi:hypothetical protein
VNDKKDVSKIKNSRYKTSIEDRLKRSKFYSHIKILNDDQFKSLLFVAKCIVDDRELGKAIELLNKVDFYSEESVCRAALKLEIRKRGIKI